MDVLLADAQTTYARLASVMWVPIIAAWTLAWNRWRMPARRSIDVSAAAIATPLLASLIVRSVPTSRELAETEETGRSARAV